ncbi:MAG: metallophosphoesterase [Vicinamibacterales bacterium]
MRTIVHLSDLHFGALDDRLLPPLRQAVCEANPDLIAVSGDLTQRARRSQFRQAREFLDSLPFHRLVVPGNHDVPLFDLASRFIDPLRGFRRHITDDLSPEFADAEILVVGLNSARSMAFSHGPGRLNPKQILQATARLNMAPPNVVKIVVTHHPFDIPDGHEAHHLVGRAEMAMSWLATVGVDLFLAGHLHVSHISQTAHRYGIRGHSALVVQAGTISRRARGELGSFNVLRVHESRIDVERHAWSPELDQFTSLTADVFDRVGDEWRPRASHHSEAVVTAPVLPRELDN